MLWLPRMAVTSCVTSRAEAASKRERRSRISEFWFRALWGRREEGGGRGSQIQLKIARSRMNEIRF